MLPTLDIKYLKGIGPARASLLSKELQVETVGDLLRICPYKYIDRTVIHRICDLREEMPFVQLRGQILEFEEEGAGRKYRLKATFTDGTGYVELVWFNGIKYIQKSLKVGKTYLLLGKPTLFNHRFAFSHPEIDDAENPAIMERKMQAHYHTTDKMKRAGFASKQMGEAICTALAQLQPDAIIDPLPPYLREKYALPDLYQALCDLHRPLSAEAVGTALRRMKFEELFFLQLDILRLGLNRKRTTQGFLLRRIGDLFNTFYRQYLPFPLTEAQKRVIRDIHGDLRSGRQMNRLLQGDVGSGKTLVALFAALIAIDNGYQATIMAPTEILAEQHLVTLRQFLHDMPGIRIELLTGNVKGKARRTILEDTERGEVHLLVGTHALIEPKVRFARLGLAIVDEQHRFGVKQRAALWEKSNPCPPHILVMTATPIPRTLAMTVYGDLDVSVIDELPPGRKPIQTVHYRSVDRPKLFAGLLHQLNQGRQVYVVYPLIQENEKLDLQALEQGYVALSEAFPQYKVGKVHGKMPPAEKDAAMAEFVEGRTRLLVSTTVIEVGVNVPNASVMVIENAERFGLAQLHQLRGRVGRGAAQSYCILMTRDELSQTTRRRISTMVESTDGFVIAEEDMRLRGPGDLEGTAQSGLPIHLRVANIIRDADLLATCRKAASEILRFDPEEKLPQNACIWQHLQHLKKLRENFSGIS